MKYNADQITVNKIPELKQLPNGKWEQTWDIVLKNPISKTIDLKKISNQLSQEKFNFNVQLRIEEKKYLTVYVNFYRDTEPYHHDHSVLLVDKMLNNIEDFLGDIDTIQGQKIEERWNIYRRTKQKSIKIKNK